MNNIRNQLRILRPPGDKDHDIFCKNKIEQKHVVKVYPYLMRSPDPHCFPPKSRKIINIRQRTKDRVSKDVARLLSPDLHPGESEDDDFRRQISKYLDEKRTDCQKRQAMTASPSMKYVFGPTEDPEAPTHANATLGRNMALWTSTRRQSHSLNDSTNIKSVMQLKKEPTNNEEAAPTHERGKSSDDKRFVRSTFSIVDDGEVVWHPSYRVAYHLLVSKGVHDPRSEDNTMKTHRQKQDKMMSYKNTHWRSTLFTALDREDHTPYVFNDIIGGGPSGEPVVNPRSTARFRPWRYRNIENPISGQCMFEVDKTRTEKPLDIQRIEEGRPHHLPHFTPLRYRSVVDPITGSVLFNVEKKENERSSSPALESQE